jgi:exopolysaccharide biosynthesis polyprenyl glycosylphosphotransferase
MLRQNVQFRNQIEQMLDAVLAAVAFTLALAIRRQLSTWRPEIFPSFDALWGNAWLYVLVIPLWVFLFDFNGMYHPQPGRSFGTIMNRVIRANILGVVLTFFILYLLKTKQIPRVLLISFAAVDIVVMCAKEFFLRWLEPMWMKPSNILLVGWQEDFADLMTRFQVQSRWKPNIIGLLSPVAGNNIEASKDASVYLGNTKDLLRVLHDKPVDYVVLSPRKEHFQEIQDIISICETEGVETWLMADFFRTKIARAHMDAFQDLPMMVFSSTPGVSWALFLKRTIDLIGSLFLILLFSPVMLAAALAIKITSRGPILFKQSRCTIRGRKFWMYKFRTMINEAENLREELTRQNEVTGPVFKIRNDPRVTPIGRFLRRYSLDELPQLFNVLVGDMSLVGPRPPIPSEVENYENWQRRRLSMRPGITCLWQISGRNQIPFTEWMRLDLEYIDNWSLWLDIEILIKTPWVVIRGTGY